MSEIDQKLLDLPIDVKNCVVLITDELMKAIGKHPNWPENNVIHCAAIVSEESGELIRAALQLHYENGSVDEVEKEAIQTGAMALRFLICR